MWRALQRLIYPNYIRARTVACLKATVNSTAETCGGSSQPLCCFPRPDCSALDCAAWPFRLRSGRRGSGDTGSAVLEPLCRLGRWKMEAHLPFDNVPFSHSHHLLRLSATAVASRTRAWCIRGACGRGGSGRCSPPMPPHLVHARLELESTHTCTCTCEAQAAYPLPPSGGLRGSRPRSGCVPGRTNAQPPPLCTLALSAATRLNRHPSEPPPKNLPVGMDIPPLISQ